MIFASLFRNPFGRFVLAGVAEATPDQMVRFLTDDDEPHYRIGRIVRDGVTVLVTREISVSGVETEQNECLFDTEEEALAFERQIEAVARFQEGGSRHGET